MSTTTTTPTDLDVLTAKVSQTLEDTGVLARIRAELRQHVFSTLSNQQQVSPAPSSSSPSSSLSTENPLLLELVQEYLSFHHLDQTLSVLQREANINTHKQITQHDRASLSKALRFPVSSAVHTTAPKHSLLYEVYVASQTSRPSSPLLSPRSEDRTLPESLSHPVHSLIVSRGNEDLTPPISPAISPTQRQRHLMQQTTAVNANAKSSSPARAAGSLQTNSTASPSYSPPTTSRSPPSLSSPPVSSLSSLSHATRSAAANVTPSQVHNNDADERAEDDNQRRLAELDRQLAALQKSTIASPQALSTSLDDETRYEEDEFDASQSTSTTATAAGTTYSDDEEVVDEHKWQRKYDIVEKVQKV